MPPAAARAVKIHDFFAHNAVVNCAYIGRHSGQVLATGSDDNTANVWRIGESRPMASLRGHSAAIDCVRFSPTEEILLSGCRDGSLRIWDLNNGGLLKRSITGSGHSVTAIDTHPFGDYFASGGADGKLEIWDTRHRKKIATYPGNSCGISVLRHSPDGQWIAVGDTSGTVKVWNLAAGKLLGELTSEHRGRVNSIVFHPTDTLLGIGSASHRLELIEIWDPDKPAPFISEFASIALPFPVQEMAFNATGDSLLTASASVVQVVASGTTPITVLDAFDVDLVGLADLAAHDSSILAACVHDNAVSLFSILLPEPLGFGMCRLFAMPDKPRASVALPLAPIAAQALPSAERRDSPPPAYRDALSEGAVAPSQPPPPVVAVAVVKPQRPPFKVDVQPPPVEVEAPEGAPLSLDEAALLLMHHHEFVMSALTTRLGKMKQLRSLWSQGRIKEALDSLLDMTDATVANAVAADFLAGTHERLKGGVLTLQLCPALLTLIDRMLASKLEDPVCTALRSLTMLLFCYTNVIRATRTQVMNSATDLSRDERLERCNACHAIATGSIMAQVKELTRRSGAVGDLSVKALEQIEGIL